MSCGKAAACSFKIVRNTSTAEYKIYVYINEYNLYVQHKQWPNAQSIWRPFLCPLSLFEMLIKQG